MAPVASASLLRDATSEECGQKLVELLPIIDRLVSWIGRRYSLTAEQADFSSFVRLQLIEKDYHILRAFGGTSKLETYLASVVINLARAYRVRSWGRWRSSTAASRLGQTAVRIETLLYRDHRPLDEVVATLTGEGELTPEEIRELALQLPPRPHPTFEDDRELVELAAAEQADDRLESGQHEALLARARAVLGEALAELDAPDRLALKLHFVDGLTVAAVARGLHLDQRNLYYRMGKSLARLRSALTRQQLSADELLAAAGWSGAAGEWPDFVEDSPSRHSQPTGGGLHRLEPIS